MKKPFYNHCKNEGHDEARCWKLHLELKPNKFAKKKREKKNNEIVQQDFGFDSGDETKIVVMCIKGKLCIASYSSCKSPSKSKINTDEWKISELFCVRIIANHTKVDTLFYSGLQVNLISEETVKKLGLQTKPHPKPYLLGWVHENAKLHVSKQCKLQFAITEEL